MDEIESLKAKVFSLFPQGNARASGPPPSIPSAPPVTALGSGTGANGFVALPPPGFPSSIPPPPPSGSPPQPNAAGSSQSLSSDPKNKAKTTAGNKTSKAAAATFWNGAAPIDPARVDEALSIGALGAMLNGIVDARVAQAHMAAVLASAIGPVERMLLESFVLLHYRLIQLQVEASRVSDPERIQAYNFAVARLQAEQTRLASALQAYGASGAITPSSSTPPLKTVSDAGNHAVDVDQSTPTNAKTPVADQSKLASKDYEETVSKLLGAKTKEPTPGGGRNDQRPAERTVAA